MDKINLLPFETTEIVGVKLKSLDFNDTTFVDIKEIIKEYNKTSPNHNDSNNYLFFNKKIK